LRNAKEGIAKRHRTQQRFIFTLSGHSTAN